MSQSKSGIQIPDRIDLINSNTQRDDILFDDFQEANETFEAEALFVFPQFADLMRLYPEVASFAFFFEEFKTLA